MERFMEGLQKEKNIFCRFLTKKQSCKRLKRKEIGGKGHRENLPGEEGPPYFLDFHYFPKALFYNTMERIRKKIKYFILINKKSI